MRRDRHLAGRRSLVNVGQEAKLLVRLHVLLQQVLPSRVGFGLCLTLLLRTQVVQEVDVLLPQGLLLRAHLRRLPSHGLLLCAKLAHSLGVLLADTELLPGQRADALTQLLAQLRLLSKDVGLLSGQLTVQRCQARLLRTKLTVLAGCGLPQLSLLQLLRAQLLANIAHVLSCSLPQLSLLGLLRGQLLCSRQPQLPGCGLLLCSRQPQLALLCGRAHLPLAGGLSKACALQAQRANLLPRSKRSDTGLAQYVGSLHAELRALETILALQRLVREPRLLQILRGLQGSLLCHLPLLQAILSGHRLVGKVGLLLHLGILQRSVVSLLGVELARGQPCLLVGKPCLQRGLLVQLLSLQSRLCLQSLCLQPCAQVLQIGLLLHALVGQSGLERLLRIHALRLQLGSLVLYRGLLLIAQVGQSHLSSSLSAQLLGSLLRCKVLLAHSQASSLIGLLRLQSCRLLSVELLLRLLVSRLQTLGLDVSFL